MIEGWRIVEAAFADNAFDGEGSRRYDGRWHSKGMPVVYTSSSIALATLELLVHLESERRVPDYVVIRCYFPEALLETVDRTRLPANWREYPAPSELQRIGGEWLAGRSSAVLEVPSAIIDREVNYLLNPEHEDFKSIDIGASQQFKLDPRLRT